MFLPSFKVDKSFDKQYANFAFMRLKVVWQDFCVSHS